MSPIPILLLKSPSPTPSTDPYTLHLTNPTPSPTTSPPPYTYTPHFVPVLSHSLLPDPLIHLLRTHLSPPNPPPFPYGALILTSQRAVAALATAFRALPPPHLKALQEWTIRFYNVGPATENPLREIVRRYCPRCEIYGGQEAGSGEKVARLMLGDGDYDARYLTNDGRATGGGVKKPVLFLTGETRRDIIPKMLMDDKLGEGRIQVDEKVVYQTAELEEFEHHFANMLQQTQAEEEVAGCRWVVVFSPTGGRGMFRALGWLDEVGVGKGLRKGRRTFVCCIGPTTGGYLQDEFGCAADVVAGRPSAQGVREGIETFMRGEQVPRASRRLNE